LFKFKNLKDNKGFTLIELMVVVSIIGILAAVAVPKLTGAADKAKDVGIMTFANSIKTGMEMHAMMNSGDYPEMSSWKDNSFKPLSENLDMVDSDESMEDYYLEKVLYKSNSGDTETYEIEFVGESENHYYLNENGFHESDPNE
jgi:prepilin-type N-terminal cleavage/methylation domain-containing protein